MPAKSWSSKITWTWLSACGLRTNLEVQGYTVMLAEDGPNRPGTRIGRDTGPAHPGPDVTQNGWHRCLKKIRASESNLPVLILTAKGNEVDKVLGLRLGADDYVTKPFGLMELIARVEALLRRSRPANFQPGAVYQFGGIEIYTESQQVLRNGDAVILTPKEYGLLLALLQRDGAVASRIELMSEVWGHAFAVISRTVDTHIAELRRKLEHDPARSRHIITVRKSGYRLDT